MRSATSMLVVAVGLVAACTRPTEAPPTPPAEPEAAIDAATLHREALLVDTHIDVPYRISEEKVDVSVRLPDGHFDFVRAREGGLDVPIFAVFVGSEFNQPGTSAGAKGGAWAEAQRIIELVDATVTKSAAVATLARTPEQLEAAVAAGKTAVLMGLENGSPIEGELEKLRQLHQQGIVYITLTHARDNHLCDSSYDTRHSHGGLSEFGREVVREMNRLGMLIDISHLSDQAAWQVLELTRAPVIASHSGLRRFRDWQRNAPDDMVQSIAKTGGVFFLNFGSAFLRDDVAKAIKERKAALKAAKDAGGDDVDAKVAAIEKAFTLRNATLAHVVEQILHLVKLVGVDHVGIGSDYDGVSDMPVGLEDVSRYPALTAALLDAGMKPDEVRKLLGANFMRVWRAVRARGAALSAVPSGSAR